MVVVTFNMCVQYNGKVFYLFIYLFNESKFIQTIYSMPTFFHFPNQTP